MNETPDPSFTITPLEDLETLSNLLRRRWGETLMMYGRPWKLGEYQAIVARDSAGEIIGLLTYTTYKAVMLVLTIDNFADQRGVGKLLLAEVSAIGRRGGAKVLRVLTTNDNTPAIRYFQMLGFKMVAFYPGAIAIYRSVTPSLPQHGVDGIPVRDALEFECDL